MARKPSKVSKSAKAAEPETAIPLPDATIESSGSNTLGRPTVLMPTSSHAVTNNLIVRDQLDPQEPLEPLSPTVLGLKELVEDMSQGRDISRHKEHIQQVAANQPEKGDVVRAYVNQANHELLADLTEMRANSVRHIKRATRRNDVTVSEALVIWRMCNDQMPDLTKGLSENDKAVDTVTVIEKIDYHRQQIERSVQKRWEGTTPQGRELIRKKLWELEQQLNAERGIMPKGIEPTEVPEDVSSEEPAPKPT